MSREDSPLILEQQVDEKEARIRMRTRIIAALVGAGAVGVVVAGSYVAEHLLEKKPRPAHETGCQPTGGANAECTLPPLPDSN